MEQWALQIYKTTGHQPLIYHGASKKTITLEQLNGSLIVITTYGAVTFTEGRDNSLLHNVDWDRIIFDEAHHLRNRNTICHISADALSARFRWLVSGTPIQNKKADFYSLCAILKLSPMFYNNINNLVRSYVLKRTKLEVGIQIADIHHIKNSVMWSNKQEQQLSEELHSVLNFSRVNPEKSDNKLFIASLFNKSKISVVLRAKQSCIYPALMSKKLESIRGIISKNEYASYKEAFSHTSKLDEVVKIVLDNKDNGSGKIIFCNFRDEIDEIATRLRHEGIDRVVTLDGRTNKSSRADILREKNNVLILQIQTGCEGLNLQENYSEIYFVAPHWNPSVEDQAIARCHRIGQNKDVYVHRFEMKSFDADTKCIDKYIGDVQEHKRILVSKIIS
jgi:SNF2 family DNA or RNA helicase